MKKIVIGLVVAAMMVLPWEGVDVGAEEVCRDVQFVFARGSGAAYRASDEWYSFRAAVETQMVGVGVSYGISDLDYPAVGINMLNALGTLVSGGEAFAFGRSVEAGRANLVKYYKDELRRCVGTRFVLMGYSQGVKVVMGAIADMDPAKVVYVANFGDPNLYLPEGVGGLRPPACRGAGLSEYRVYAPDCTTNAGLLGAKDPYMVAGYAGKIGLWCNEDDLICGSSKNLLVNSGHTEYGKLGHFGAAVRKVVEKIRGVSATSVGAQAAMDTAILIDSTGSMGSYITRYRVEAMDLAMRTLASGGRVALYEYRDLNDPFELRQLCDFDCSFAEFKTKLDGIRVGGGGDTPESVLSGTLGVMNTLKWQKGATKSIVVLTDAPYHAPDRDGTTLAQVAQRSLEIDPVNIYVITEDSVKAEYEELARLTGGRVFGVGEMAESTEYIMSRPVAVLPYEIYMGAVGEKFYFDASESYGVGAEIEYFEWDLDGDGEFEMRDLAGVVETTFGVVGERFVVVRVVARDGGASTMSAVVRVVADDGALGVLPRVGVVKDLSVAEVDGGMMVRWKLPDGAKYGLVSVDGVVLGYVEGEELLVSDVGLAAEVEFAVAAMDETFDMGEFVRVRVGAAKSVSGEGVAKNESAESEDVLEVRAAPSIAKPYDVAAKLEDGLNFELPNTGSAEMDWAFGVPVWLLLVIGGVGLVYVLMRRKG